MKRLNKLGYNISIVLEWEKREIEADVEANVIRVSLPGDTKNTKYYWSLKPLEDSFDDLVKQLRAQDQRNPTWLSCLSRLTTQQRATRRSATPARSTMSNSGLTAPSAWATHCV